MGTPLTDAGSPNTIMMEDLTMGMENLNSNGKEKRLRAGSKKKAGGSHEAAAQDAEHGLVVRAGHLDDRLCID